MVLPINGKVSWAKSAESLPSLLFEKGKDRILGANEVGGKDGDPHRPFEQAVRRLGGALDRRRGTAGELAGAGEPHLPSPLFVEVEQGVGAAGQAAAEGAVRVRRLPGVPGGALGQPAVARLAQQGLGERPEEDETGAAVAP